MFFVLHRYIPIEKSPSIGLLAASGYTDPEMDIYIYASYSMKWVQNGRITVRVLRSTTTALSKD